jgi:hypothetical protein
VRKGEAMTTCKDCKHWGTGKRQREWESARDGYNSHADEDDKRGERPQKICARVTLLGSDYESLPKGLHDDPDLPNVMAYTLDASRYQADLWTAPEFGCTLWEESVQPPEGP